MLSVLDWTIVGIFLFISLFIGLYFRKQAGKSLSDFFLGGRNLPWYIAGISMVATTFAADTPLWVTEKVKQHGISGNWLWWNMVISGVLTTFFFAHLWRRANIITELELIEIRYSGKAAQFLRGFKSVYLGLFLNCIIIGWVNFAMVTILKIFLNLPDSTAYLIIIGLMLLVAIYSSISGLLGVAFTDALQFILAMGGCILLAYFMLDSEQIGGIQGMKEKLAHESWRLNFFPSIGENSVESYSIPILSFLAFIGIQWWSSWYPGAEPGGGGYVAQRMMSAKNEKHAVWATLFFQLAHYALRPWPWIIIALCALIVYPDLSEQDSGQGFVMAMRDFMPNGLKGMMFAAFLGAYMSTISTQLNWGASFLTNDLYKRFIKPSKYQESDTSTSKEKEDLHYVLVARLSTFLIMIIAFLVTLQIDMIDKAAKFLIACGAGLGLVLILRWYWWRINAWSEISATIAPLIAYSVSIYFLEDYFGETYTNSSGTLVFTVLFTTVVWLTVTYLTKPTDFAVLSSFYTRVRPQGNWNKVHDRLKESDRNPKQSMLPLFVCWASATIMIYSVLFSIGKFIFQDYAQAFVWLASSIICAFVLNIAMKKSNFFLKS